MPILRVGLCPNLTAAVIEKLQKEGIKNVLDFVAEDMEQLAKSTGISYKVVFMFSVGATLFMYMMS